MIHVMFLGLKTKTLRKKRIYAIDSEEKTLLRSLKIFHAFILINIHFKWQKLTFYFNLDEKNVGVLFFLIHGCLTHTFFFNIFRVLKPNHSYPFKISALNFPETRNLIAQTLLCILIPKKEDRFRKIPPTI